MKKVVIFAVLAMVMFSGVVVAEETKAPAPSIEKAELQQKLTILNDRAVGIQKQMEMAQAELQQRLQAVQAEAKPVVDRLNEIAAAEKKATEPKAGEKK